MDELIEEIQAAFESGAPEFPMRADLFATTFKSSVDGVEAVASLFALSNGWAVTVTSDRVIFKPQ